MSPPKPTLIPLTPNERRAAVGLAGIYGLRMLGLFLILPVFALYATGLTGATPLLIGLAIGAYGLTQAILQIPFGMLSDRIGRKPVIFGGLAIFVIGSVMAALSTSIEGRDPGAGDPGGRGGLRRGHGARRRPDPGRGAHPGHGRGRVRASASPSAWP